MLLQAGNRKAQIIVLCDDPKQEHINNRTPICKEDFRVFAKNAVANHFGSNDFFFLSCSDFIPTAFSGTDAKKRKYAQKFVEEIRSTIQQVSPSCVITLGKVSSSLLMGREMKITQARGKRMMIPDMDIPVYFMLSPSYVRLYPEHENLFVHDFFYFKKFKDVGYKVDVNLTENNSSYVWCKDLSPYISYMEKAGLVALDTETTGLDWYKDDVVPLTVQFSYKEGHALVCPVHDIYYGEPENGSRLHLREQIKSILENPKIKKVGHNLKYDYLILRKSIGKIRGWENDTMLLAFFADENMKDKSLDECTRRWVPSMAGYADLFNSTYDKEKMIEIPIDELKEYAGGDTDACLRLYHVLTKEVSKDVKHYRCYKTITFPASRNFGVYVEPNGMKVDFCEMDKLKVSFSSRMKDIYDSLMNMIPQAVKDKHEAKGLKFSRSDFVRDIMFSADGFRLKPVLFTKSTKGLDHKDKIPSTDIKKHFPYFSDHPFVAGYTEYKKMMTISNNFMNGFHKWVDNKNYIHPTYLNHKVVTGRACCLAGDTSILVLDARIRVSIQDIKEGDKVLCFDDNKNPTFDTVIWSGETKKDKVVRVWFQTQGSRKEYFVECTEDHKFRLRNGEYVEAGFLRYGDRLLSMEQSINKGGYSRVYCTGVDGDLLVHRIVYNYFGHDKIIHHKDHNKLNNSPTNLLSVRKNLHTKLFHPWKQESKDKLSVSVKKRYQEIVESGISLSVYFNRKKGKDHPVYKHLSKEFLVDALYEGKGKPTYLRDILGFDYECVMKKIKDYNIDWKKIREEFNDRGEKILDLIETAKQCSTIKEAAKVLGVNFYRAKYLLSSDHNHMVLRVEYMDKVIPVYDITTEKYHNFIANGVCVHNSARPNGQNLPKRGALAKQYRKIFSPSEGYVFVEADFSQAELRVAATMAKDPVMLKVYRDGGDIHKVTGAAINRLSLSKFDTLPKEKQKTFRQQAKCVNFGLLYGMGAKGLMNYAKTDYGVDMEIEEAEEFRNIYFKTYAGLIPWHKNMVSFCKKHGYVRGLLGAKHTIPTIYSHDEYIRSTAERYCVNYPVQRCASDLGLLAKARICADADQSKLRCVGFVHDALIFEVRQDCLEEMMSAIKWYMENQPLKQLFGFEFPIPIVADVSVGRESLSEMEEVKVEARRPSWNKEKMLKHQGFKL